MNKVLYAVAFVHALALRTKIPAKRLQDWAANEIMWVSFWLAEAD